MRATSLLSVVAAQLACAEPLNERADVSKQTQGVSFGSPPQPVKASFGFDSSELFIPPFINGTNGANITRNFTFGDMDDAPNSYTDHPIFGEQKVVVNGFELQNFTFDGWHSDYIYVGLCLEYNPDPEPQYTTISTIESLKDSGYIKSRSFSVFYNTSALELEANEVLFGAIDHGKYEGPLVKHKLYMNLTVAGEGYTIHPTLAMDGMAGYNFLVSEQIVTLITDDYWYLPPEYIAALDTYFQDRYGFNLTNVSCLIMDLTEYISFYFSGVEYRMLDSGFFSSYVENGTTFCYFPGGTIDSILFNYEISRKLFSHHYLVVDYDHEEIGIAQAATKSNPPTIEELSTGIPLATPAKYYSYTSLDETVVILSDSEFYLTTSIHPSNYSMYTGERLGWSATEEFYLSHTSSSDPSHSVTLVKPTASSTAGNSTKASSSSKGVGALKGASALTFIGCILGALMMF